MGSKRPMEPECLTYLMQMGVIDMNIFMGVCSLLRACHRRQAGNQGPTQTSSYSSTHPAALTPV